MEFDLILVWTIAGAVGTAAVIAIGHAIARCMDVVDT